MGCAAAFARAVSRTASTRSTCRRCGRRPAALAGARQWIPAQDIKDPVKSLVTGLPPDLRFRAKGQLAMKTSELAFCYCYVPAGQRPLTRLAKTYDQPAAVARMPGSMSGVVDPRTRSFLVIMLPWKEP